MKSLIILLISINFASILNAQNTQDSIAGPKPIYKKGITTEEEYNYMSKGYKIQIESGLDMKKGYLIGDENEIRIASYIFKYITLLKISGKDTLNVGYITKATSTSWGNTYWYCIPLNNEELLNKTQSQISTLDYPMITAFLKSYLLLTTVYLE